LVWRRTVREGRVEIERGLEAEVDALRLVISLAKEGVVGIIPGWGERCFAEEKERCDEERREEEVRPKSLARSGAPACDHSFPRSRDVHQLLLQVSQTVNRN
jgi:hypothetical protein